MKVHKLAVLVFFAVLATPGFADNRQVEGDGYDVMLDMILRPVGLVGTIIGAGIYVGVSPLTGMAAIAPPHNAFVKLADTLVCKPAKYTFLRPVGDYRYDEGCDSHVQAPVAQPVVRYVPPAPTIAKPQPPVQYPKDINKKLDTLFKKEMMK